MTEVLLDAVGLEKRFAGVVAASAVSIAIEEGERLGVIGANGAGNTTFVNMVTGYLKPDAGTIHFRGRNITALEPRQITRLDLCRSFQIPQLFPGISVQDNVLIARAIARSERLDGWRLLRDDGNIEAAATLLAAYDLLDYRENRVAELPQGGRKLLDIAMTTVGEPALVLLDEPTSGISMDEKFQIMDIIMGALERTRTTVMFIEHDMEVVERYAPRVVAFYDGRVIADGPTAETLAHAEVREYVIGRELHRRT